MGVRESRWEAVEKSHIGQNGENAKSQCGGTAESLQIRCYSFPSLHTGSNIISPRFMGLWVNEINYETVGESMCSSG